MNTSMAFINTSTSNLDIKATRKYEVNTIINVSFADERLTAPHIAQGTHIGYGSCEFVASADDGLTFKCCH